MRQKSLRQKANSVMRRRVDAKRHRNSTVSAAAQVSLQSIPAAPTTEAPTWRLETLEPRLLMSADAMPGIHAIEGSVDQPGEQDRFEFVVSEKTRFVFDGVQGDQIQWRLEGGNADDRFDFRSLTATGDRFLELDPGSYNLIVDGQNDKTGAYAFQLIGVEATQPLILDTVTTGTLQAGTQAAMYSVNLDAGDRLYFQPSLGNGGGGWALFDPTAAKVWGQNNLQTDAGPFVAQRAGTYWMSVEGQSGATAAVDYGFTLFRHAARSEVLVLGQEHTATLDGPGDAASYTFDLDRATQVQWDQLTGGLSNAKWTLLDAKINSTVASGSLSTQDGTQNPIRVGAGSYVLRVEGVGRGQGVVAFRLLTSALAGSAADGVPVSVGSALGGQVVRIDAAQAGTLSLGYVALPDAVSPPTLARARELLVASGTSASVPVTIGAEELGVALLRVLAVAGDRLDLGVADNDFVQRLRLFDARGIELTTSIADALSWTAENTGIYYVGISRASNATYDPRIDPPLSATTSAGALTLSVQRTPSQAIAATDVPDTLPQATDALVARDSAITLDVTIGDGANGDRDVDWYRLVLGAGEVLRLSTPNGTFDGYARVFDAAGAEVGRTDDSPLAYTVPDTGVYYVAISGYPNSTFDPFVEAGGVDGRTGTLSLTITRERNAALPTAQWIVTDNSGARLGIGSLTPNGVATIDLPQAGSYYLWSQPGFGIADRRGELRLAQWSDVAASVTALTRTAAQVIGTTLTHSGQVITKELTVAEGGVWILEPTQAFDNAQWRLTGPRGTEFDWQPMRSAWGRGRRADSRIFPQLAGPDLVGTGALAAGGRLHTRTRGWQWPRALHG